eukprot:TRINITY_DN875_c0_g2_i1.p1 TRINITY_DN875_c0_g2~~TRINITY_DN875_c0_g2_i1.p1  ORF type:complete len:290 (+),score=56.48 TRINITY_DN875_c0_g2_i1:154-1023(+)
MQRLLTEETSQQIEQDLKMLSEHEKEIAQLVPIESPAIRSIIPSEVHINEAPFEKLKCSKLLFLIHGLEEISTKLSQLIDDIEKDPKKLQEAMQGCIDGVNAILTFATFIPEPTIKIITGKIHIILRFLGIFKSSTSSPKIALFILRGLKKVVDEIKEQFQKLAIENDSLIRDAETKIPISEETMSKLKTATIGGASAAVGGIAAVLAAPAVLSAAGFGAGGIVGGSVAAAWMASSGPIAAGSTFALLQSAGAAGLGTAATGGLAAIGAAVSATTGYLSNKMFSGKQSS